MPVSRDSAVPTATTLLERIRERWSVDKASEPKPDRRLDP